MHIGRVRTANVKKTEPDRMRIESIHLLRWIETGLNWIGMKCCWARSLLRDHVRTSVVRMAARRENVETKVSQNVETKALLGIWDRKWICLLR